MAEDQETEDEKATRLLTARFDRNLPKRFYKQVTLGEADGGYDIRLDGRVVKTPLKRAFAVPSRGMAEAIAAEWEAQETHINPATMIITRLANTAVDRVAGDEARIVAEIVDFAAADLLCYRAEGPTPLVERQNLHWNKVIDWMHQTHGARFVCVEGVVHAEQPQTSLDKVAEVLTGEDPFRLTAIHNLTTLTGSALLALMTASGALPGEEAWAAAHADEDWQIEQWGSDDEAEDRRAVRKTDFDTTLAFLRMCA